MAFVLFDTEKNIKKKNIYKSSSNYGLDCYNLLKVNKIYTISEKKS